jgi:hypothetical protein
MQCSPVKINRRFEQRYRLHFHDRRIRQVKNNNKAGTKKEIEFFITTAVVTSDPTCYVRINKIILLMSLRKIHTVGFEVLRAVIIKRSIFWEITSCSPLQFNRRFGGRRCLHLQCWINETTNQHEESGRHSQCWLTFIDYTALYPRRYVFKINAVRLKNHKKHIN